MTTGTVKWFSHKKGYGFICSDDVEADIFVHYSAIKMKGFRILNRGQQVTFDVQQTKNGPVARGIQPMNAPSLDT